LWWNCDCGCNLKPWCDLFDGFWILLICVSLWCFGDRCEAAFICFQEGGQDRWKGVAFACLQGALPSGVSGLAYPWGGIIELWLFCLCMSICVYVVCFWVFSGLVFFFVRVGVSYVMLYDLKYFKGWWLNLCRCVIMVFVKVWCSVFICV